MSPFFWFIFNSSLTWLGQFWARFILENSSSCPSLEFTMSINDVILMSILALTALNCISDRTRILIMQVAQWKFLNQMNKLLVFRYFHCTHTHIAHHTCDAACVRVCKISNNFAHTDRNYITCLPTLTVFQINQLIVRSGDSISRIFKLGIQTFKTSFKNELSSEQNHEGSSQQKIGTILEYLKKFFFVFLEIWGHINFLLRFPDL